MYIVYIAKEKMMFRTKYWLTLFVCLILVWTSLGRPSFARAHIVLTPAACPTSVDFGASFDCDLSAVNEVDTFSFNATAQDQILFRALTQTGNMAPYIEIFSPNGSRLCFDYTNNVNATVECTIAQTGTHVLSIKSSTSNGTGTYQVYTQRYNQPGHAENIAFGQIAESATTSRIQSESFVFSANAGDLLNVRISQISGTYHPSFVIYSQKGEIMCRDFSNLPTLNTDCSALPESGTFSIFLWDLTNSIGSYRFVLQRLNAPGNTTPLSFGVPITGEITRLNEMDAYTFGANQNDYILVRVVRETGEIGPDLAIYRTNGTKFCSTFSNNTTADIACDPIPAAGSYGFFVTTANSRVGQYKIYMQRLNNPGNARGLTFGQTLTGSIDALAAFDTYSATVVASDSFSLTMSTIVGKLRPSIRVYGPNGALICSGWSNLASVETNRCVATISGVYTIIVDDVLAAQIGSYALKLNCITPRCGPKPILDKYVYLSILQK